MEWCHEERDDSRVRGRRGRGTLPAVHALITGPVKTCGALRGGVEHCLRAGMARGPGINEVPSPAEIGRGSPRAGRSGRRRLLRLGMPTRIGPSVAAHGACAPREAVESDGDLSVPIHSSMPHSSVEVR